MSYILDSTDTVDLHSKVTQDVQVNRLIDLIDIIANNLSTKMNIIKEKSISFESLYTDE